MKNLDLNHRLKCLKYWLDWFAKIIRARISGDVALFSHTRMYVQLTLHQKKPTFSNIFSTLQGMKQTGEKYITFRTTTNAWYWTAQCIWMDYTCKRKGLFEAKSKQYFLQKLGYVGSSTRKHYHGASTVVCEDFPLLPFI